MKRSSTWWVAALVVSVTVAAQAEAGFWQKLNIFSRWSAKSRVDYVLVTGNFAKPRLLAELLQNKTKQPVLLLASGERGGKLYFLPSQPEAMELPEEQFVEFIDWLQPKTVVILGDATYVPADFVSAVKDRYPTVMIPGNDWVQNAAALAHFSRVGSLPKLYADLLDQLACAEPYRAADTSFSPASSPLPAGR